MYETFFSSCGRTSSSMMSSMRRPLFLSSDSNIARPRSMFSSRRSFLNHCFIFVRAEPLFAILSQSRLGPAAFFEVLTSTISPFCST